MSEEKKYFTRMGDGSAVWMTEEEIRNDIAAGMADAVRRGKVPALEPEEVAHLYDIITMPGIIVGVEMGEQVVSTTDSGSDKLGMCCDIPIDRSIQAQVHEKGFGCDSVDLGYPDYSYKAVKSVASVEGLVAQRALMSTVIPMLYGAMPNLGFYTKPDGPYDNWSELLPQGKLTEALEAQEMAVGNAVHDMVYVAETMYKAGMDGINIDTCGAAGDADFLASLKATELIREKCPGMGVEMGMAGEFVLGMHGRVEYQGERLAGLYPHKQVKVCEKAGATIFGAVVNTNSTKTFPWNIARVCTFIKECSKVAEIPVHVNVGMGVGGVPMAEVLPCDVVSRADKALIEICKIDGL